MPKKYMKWSPFTLPRLRAKYLVYCIIFPIVLFSCKEKKDYILDAALDSSGKNKNELLKVLNHYVEPSDSLKRKAAFFLIKNMTDKYFYSGKPFERYDVFFDHVKKVMNDEQLDLRGKKERFSFIFDSLQIEKASRDLELEEDIIFMKSSYLIENIDMAFIAWETYPWSENVSFEDFCQYILPYKVFNEPIEPWRKTLMDRYSWVLDSIKNPKSLREATILINQRFNETMTYFTRMNRFPTALSFGTLDTLKMGACDHLVTMNIYCLRAMGIPAKVDQALWGNHHGTHKWCSITDENGFLFAFDALYQPKNITDSIYMKGHFNTIPESNLRNRKAPKILRHTYENRHTKLLQNDSMKSRIISKELMNINSLDVTFEYDNPATTIELEIASSSKEDVAFLNVFNRDGWKPVAWSIRGPDGLYKFENMGTGIVYLPVLKNYNIGFIKNLPPFILNDDGTINSINADKNKLKTIKIDRKYYLDYDLEIALKKMIGGIFQGANHEDFRDETDLFRIASMPKPKTNNYKISSKDKFRYIRFILPDNLCRVAEMKLFGKLNLVDNEPIKQLSGTLISSQYSSNNIPERIIDGDVLTYFVANSDKGGWVGLDLGYNNESYIESIDFYPPNDGNSVEIGDLYELYYWNNGWESLGTKIAYKEELIYTNCPDKALFLLKNHTKGVQVRIFTYNKDKQVWW